MSTEGFFILSLAIVEVGLILWKLHTDAEHGEQIRTISREHTLALNRIGQAEGASLGPVSYVGRGLDALLSGWQHAFDSRPIRLVRSLR